MTGSDVEGETTGVLSEIWDVPVEVPSFSVAFDPLVAERQNYFNAQSRRAARG